MEISWCFGCILLYRKREKRWLLIARGDRWQLIMEREMRDIKGEMRRKELWDLILFEVTNDMWITCYRYQLWYGSRRCHLRLAKHVISSKHFSILYYFTIFYFAKNQKNSNKLWSENQNLSFSAWLNEVIS